MDEMRIFSNISELQGYEPTGSSPASFLALRFGQCGLLVLVVGLFLATGCQRFGSKLTPGDLSLLPKGKLSSGQWAWNATTDQRSKKFYSERHDTTVRVEDLTPENLPKTIRKLTGHGPNKEVAEKHFAAGKSAYRKAIAAWKQSNGKSDVGPAFLDAIDELELAAEKWPDSSIEEQSLFMISECYFFGNNFNKAEESYQNLLKLYPSTSFLDKVQSHRFSIARYWIETGKRQGSVVNSLNLTDKKLPTVSPAAAGRRILDQIRLDDPTGKLADDATFEMGRSLFADKYYFEAAETFSDLRNNYPGSSHQFNAHLMEFESRLSMYDGKNYDGAALKQAEELLRIILKRFPDRSRKIKDKLAAKAAGIRTMLAERDLVVGDYYANRGENAAARTYYNTVIRDFPETPVAGDAKKKIAQLQGKPDNPKQYAKWLSDLFPAPERAKELLPKGAIR